MRKKIIYYCVLIGLLTVAVGFGLYNLIAGTSYKNNELTFKVNNEDAFFEATGTYFYGETQTPTSTYAGAKYSQEDYYAGNGPTTPVWELGTSEFVFDSANTQNNVTTITYVITVKNLNTEKNLNVDVKGIAVHVDAHFITKVDYKIGSATEQTVFSNNEESPVNIELYDSSKNYVDITNRRIASGETMQVTITLSLNTKTKQFTVDNNITFELTAVDA